MPVAVNAVPGLLTIFFAADAADATTRGAAGLRPRGLRARSAARCWPAASTRRPRSTRRGSRPLAHTSEHLDRTLDAANAAFAELS